MACAPGHLHVARASLSTAVSGEFHFGAQQLPVLSVVAATSPPACRDAGKGLHLLMARRRVTLQKRTWDGRCPRAILETTVCHSLPPCCSSGPEMQVQPPAPPGCGADPSRLLPSIPLSSSLTFLLPELPSPPPATAHDLPLTGGPSRLLAMFPALVFSPLAFCLVACFPPAPRFFGERVPFMKRHLYIRPRSFQGVLTDQSRFSPCGLCDFIPPLLGIVHR